jgi:hypothetical protein
VTYFFAINYSILGKITLIKRPAKTLLGKGPDGGLSQLQFFPELVLNFFQINTSKIVLESF